MAENVAADDPQLFNLEQGECLTQRHEGAEGRRTGVRRFEMTGGCRAGHAGPWGCGLWPRHSSRPRNRWGGASRNLGARASSPRMWPARRAGRMNPPEMARSPNAPYRESAALPGLGAAGGRPPMFAAGDDALSERIPFRRLRRARTAPPSFAAFTLYNSAFQLKNQRIEEWNALASLANWRTPGQDEQTARRSGGRSPPC